MKVGRVGLLMENLENKAEESVSAKGSRKSQKFFFCLFLMIIPLLICIKLYTKGIHLVMACRKDTRCLEFRTPVL